MCLICIQMCVCVCVNMQMCVRVRKRLVLTSSNHRPSYFHENHSCAMDIPDHRVDIVRWPNKMPDKTDSPVFPKAISC